MLFVVCNTYEKVDEFMNKCFRIENKRWNEQKKKTDFKWTPETFYNHISFATNYASTSLILMYIHTNSMWLNKEWETMIACKHLETWTLWGHWQKAVSSVSSSVLTRKTNWPAKIREVSSQLKLLIRFKATSSIRSILKVLRASISHTGAESWSLF